MSFGRKKRNENVDEDVEVDEAVIEADAEAELALGETERWDAEFSRNEGPFDISEVDLEADAHEVNRLDLGSLIITPFQDMTMQLQVNRESNQVQSILVGDGQSALEVAVFAGPAKSSMTGEIRDEVLESTRQQGGRCQAVKGHFGTELPRALPAQDPNGNPAMHLSRTWLVPGPGWVLRGVLLGKATFSPDDEDAQLHLFEFFSNLVVRRGSTPAAPGSLLPMRVPEAKG